MPENVVSGLEKSDIVQVDRGVIHSRVEAGITERSSELHRRGEIGVTWAAGSASVGTGKLTSAPLFARRPVDQFPGP